MGETAGKPSTPSPVDSPPAIRSHTEPTNIRQPAWKWVDSIKGGLSDQLVNSFLCQSASISVLLQQFRAPDGLAGLVVVARQLRLYTVPGTLATNYIHVEQIRRENKLVISLNIDSAGCLIFFFPLFSWPASVDSIPSDSWWLVIERLSQVTFDRSFFIFPSPYPGPAFQPNLSADTNGWNGSYKVFAFSLAPATTMSASALCSCCCCCCMLQQKQLN